MVFIATVKVPFLFGTKIKKLLMTIFTMKRKKEEEEEDYFDDIDNTDQSEDKTEEKQKTKKKKVTKNPFNINVYEKEFDISNSKFIDKLSRKKIFNKMEHQIPDDYVPDNTKDYEGCSKPLKNNPMLNQLPGNLYKDIFACPLTKEFKNLQHKYLFAPIKPGNNTIFYDRSYDRQFVTLPRRLGMSYYIGSVKQENLSDNSNQSEFDIHILQILKENLIIRQIQTNQNINQQAFNFLFL